MVKDFDHLELKPDLLRGVYAYGFEAPSVIQDKAIPILIKGKDTIAQAQSGTGKTGAFSIGCLQLIDPKIKQPQGLILAPTRELATQIYSVISSLNLHLKLNLVLCIGGTKNSNKDVAKAQVVVGTPGRVLDLLRREILCLEQLKIFILDEADEMLDEHGFQDDIYTLLKSLPLKAQIALFSATLPPSILALTEKFMRDPEKILVKQEALTLEGIRQFYVLVSEDRYKLDVLIDLYKSISIGSAVIFCNTNRRVDRLVEALQKEDFAVSKIHSGIPAEERHLVMRKFRLGETRVLVSSDLLARGIDVQHVSLVINYDLVRKIESYLHRIGRSGRFGRRGVAINLITPDDEKLLKDIEGHYDTKVEELPENIGELL